jgi:predicted nucleotidyltransferase
MMRVYSVARGTASSDSDIALPMSFAPGAILFDHSGLRPNLMGRFGVTVNVIGGEQNGNSIGTAVSATGRSPRSLPT